MTLQDPRQLDMWGQPIAAPAEPPAEPAPVRVIAPAVSVGAGRQLRALQASLPVIRDADPDPAGLEGWREELGAPMPRIVGGVCSEVAARTCPDGTLAPCPRVRCPHHLGLHVGEVTEVGPIREAELVISTAGLPPEMGRRPALPALPETHGEVEAFQGAAVEALARLPDTCELEVVARYPDGVPVEEIARVLGVSEEIVRIDTVAASRKLLRAAGLPDRMAALPSHESWSSGVDHAAALERIAPTPKPRRPRVRRSKAAPPPPVPRAIVRVERDAPAPREPTAEDVFTF